MKHTSLVRKFEKAGYTVGTVDYRPDQFLVVHNGRRVKWFDQSGEAICIHCYNVGEESRAEVDYFPGFFAHTGKMAVSYLGWE